MSFFQKLLGHPLLRNKVDDERLPSVQALPILSSDALSSVAYATEAALGVLILGGSGALGLSVPITLAIIALVAILVNITPSITRAPWRVRSIVIGDAFTCL